MFSSFLCGSTLLFSVTSVFRRSCGAGYAPPIFLDGVKDCVRRHDHGWGESSPLPPVLSEAESTGIDAGQIRHAPESAIPVRVAQAQIKILPLPAPNAENRNLDSQFPASTLFFFSLDRARPVSLFDGTKREMGGAGLRKLLDLQFLSHIIQIDGQNLGYALFLHVVLTSFRSFAAACGDRSLPPPLVLFPPKPLSLGFGGSPVGGVTMHHFIFNSLAMSFRLMVRILLTPCSCMVTP